MVMNRSKGRFGSIVNETLKNGHLILIDTSKESAFMLILNILVSSNLDLLINIYGPEEMCLIWKIGGNTL